MFSLPCKRLLQYSRDKRVLLDLQRGLQFLQLCTLKTSLDTKEGQDHSFTISYLVNTCGFPPETAVSISKKVHFETSDKPDAFISCLRYHGLKNTQISTILKTVPTLLTSNVEKSILPKIKFLQSVGVSNADLPKIVTQNPNIFTRSLKNCLIPSHSYLRNLLGNEEKVVTVMMNLVFSFPGHVIDYIAPNVLLLQQVGVSQSSIAASCARKPSTFCANPRKFHEKLHLVLNMGFEPSSSSFLRALEVTLQISEQTWKHKMEVYRKWGLSDDEILSVFKKNPQCMALSEKKIAKVMDFFVNKKGQHPSFVTYFYQSLNYSLEKHIIPRCSVTTALLSKGILSKEDFTYNSLLTVSEEVFLKRFVFKYKELVPELLDIYQKEKVMVRTCESFVRTLTFGFRSNGSKSKNT